MRAGFFSDLGRDNPDSKKNDRSGKAMFRGFAITASPWRKSTEIHPPGQSISEVDRTSPGPVPETNSALTVCHRFSCQNFNKRAKIAKDRNVCATGLSTPAKVERIGQNTHKTSAQTCFVAIISFEKKPLQN